MRNYVSNLRELLGRNCSSKLTHTCNLCVNINVVWNAALFAFIKLFKIKKELLG